MRRSPIRRSLPALFLVACVVVSAPAASATVIDRDVGFDPDDVRAVGRIHPDIRSTTRKLVAHGRRRVVSIVVRFYEADGGYPLSMRLDARGGPQVDHLVFTSFDTCFLWRKGHRDDGQIVRFAARGHRAVCRFPARDVAPTKSIRWKLWTYPPDGSRGTGGFEIDYAPDDRGWYG